MFEMVLNSLFKMKSTSVAVTIFLPLIIDGTFDVVFLRTLSCIGRNFNFVIHESDVL